jgi:hemolysin activation/secretion protein
MGPRRFEDRWLWRTGLTALWARTGAWRTVDVRAQLDAGTLAGDRAPPQALFLLGGRETLLGHPYRAFVGRHFWLLRVEADRPLAAPWISARAFGSAGGVEGVAPTDLPSGWGDLESDRGALASVGVGISLLWDVLRIDLGRGLGGGGDWDTALSVVHRFRRWL